MKIKLMILLLFISINTSALEIYPLISDEVTLIKSIGSSVKQGDLLVQIDNA
ncbi:hypothetical protein [Abyssogena phaseoliformis symbiont]|uniref:hypothetical protein n=1 Tax=Abyssogena phaseoliformis symbiont TaxID=596095 RepID=UPI001916481A|nr:hypothetical protein [Abyssogena phaseoliformis symbiont]